MSHLGLGLSRKVVRPWHWPMSDIQTERHADRQTDTQTQTDGQTDRDTDRQLKCVCMLVYSELMIVMRRKDVRHR